MSNTKGDESGSTSEKIVTYVINKYDKLTKASNDVIKYHHTKEFIDKANLVFRKICHFSGYLVLSLLAFNFFMSFNKFSLLKCNIYTITFSIIYAITDEIHQLFISERNGNIIDVLIDSGGIIIGSLIMSSIIKRKKDRV